MLDPGVEVLEQVVLMSERVEHAHVLDDAAVLCAKADEEHCDAAILEMTHDVAEGLSAGRVQHFELAQAKDHDLDICDVS